MFLCFEKPWESWESHTTLELWNPGTPETHSDPLLIPPLGKGNDYMAIISD